MLHDTVTIWATGARHGAGAVGEGAEDQHVSGCRESDGAYEEVALWCITLHQYTASERLGKAEQKTYCTVPVLHDVVAAIVALGREFSVQSQ